MKKVLKKGLTIFVLFAYLFTLVPVNLLALENNNNYQEGQVVDAYNYNGSLDTAGDVLFSKTVNKTQNEKEYLVTLNVKGKNKITTSSKETKLYVAIAFDISTSMKYTKTKFQNAKNGVISFMNQMRNNYSSIEFALVTYESESNIVSNFTTDDLSSTVQNLSIPNRFLGTGTHLGDGIYDAKNY